MAQESGNSISRTLPPLLIELEWEGRRLYFRPLDVLDRPLVKAAIAESGEHLKRFMSWAHLTLKCEESVRFFAQWRFDYFSGRSFNWGIFDAENNAFLGVIGLVPGYRLNTNCWEAGYWVAKRHSKQGIGTLALKTLLLVSFHCFDLDCFQVLCPVENEASRCLVEKCGFSCDGELRNVLQKPSQKMIESGYTTRRNAHLFSLVPEECEKHVWAQVMKRAIKLTPIEGEPLVLSELHP